LWALPVLFVLLAAVPASAAMIYGDITVNIEPEPKGASTHGYAEYQVSVTNRSAERSHRVRLSTPKGGGNPRHSNIREISRTVDIGPEATVRVPLYQLARPPVFGGGLSVSIDGREQDDVLQLNFAPVRNEMASAVSRGFGPARTFVPAPMSGSGALILYSRSVSNDFPDVADHQTQIHRFGHVVGSRQVAQFMRAEAPLSEWGTSWLGYSRYDGIVVTGDDLRRAPTGVQSALAQFVECGGSLLVQGPGGIPPHWKRFENNEAGFRTYRAGFGECLATADTNLAKWNGSLWKALGESWIRTTAPLRQIRTAADANRLFPVIEEVSIPVRGLFLLMVFFAVLIGPVNLVVLSRMNRRIWLLWTAPAISLVTCAAVFGYMLLAEGWEGHLRTEGLTLLDETSRRATTIGWTAFYTPMAPSDGLHFSYDTELSPQNVEDQQTGGTACTLDWTNEQHLAAGWVTARVPAHFLVRKSEARRERVTLERAGDGALTIVNALGADIREFWYADDRQGVYTAGPVPSGGRAALTPTGETLALEGKGSDLRSVFSAEWTMSADTYVGNPQRFLLPRGYVAALDAAPFLEDGLRNAKNRRYRSVVVGLLKNDE
jgi:hypothetical protein